MASSDRRSRRGTRREHAVSTASGPATLGAGTMRKETSALELPISAAGAPGEDVSELELLKVLGVASPARRRQIVGRGVADFDAAPGGCIAGASASQALQPPLWDASGPLIEADGSASVPKMSYRDQLRANGQQALQRSWDRGIGPKTQIGTPLGSPVSTPVASVAPSPMGSPCVMATMPPTPPVLPMGGGSMDFGMPPPPPAPPPTMDAQAYMAMCRPPPPSQTPQSVPPMPSCSMAPGPTSPLAWSASPMDASMYQMQPPASEMNPILSPFGAEPQVSNPFCFDMGQAQQGQMTPTGHVTPQSSMQQVQDSNRFNMMAIVMPQAANYHFDNKEIAAQLEAAASSFDVYED
eukprot:gnl/TRDRNA2_/TRDRNA2_84888_c0_seq1.p1 gnl/TRDRNA2_/TRDRNA2_84888_c0~~gnl/TRDRNA2_/TRDRNA2_84888_c0_seq1.p1  ORF type:complete len:364 (-),score=77.83 gnl/TRDRNA2_/TRDRNA2_84888_c0_seq1:277-1332(-)